MITHTVIESFDAYTKVRNAYPTQQRLWWTTSPKLLAILPDHGEQVRSPEESLSQEEVDALAKRARDLAVDFSDWYQEKSSWNSYINFRLVLGANLARCLFVTSYKALLLSRIVHEAGAEPVVCVGDPDEPGFSGLSMAYGRVDTLFSFVAAEAKELGISIVKHKNTSNLSNAIDDAVRNRPMGKLEKLLSVLNNTPGSFLYKAFRTLQHKGLFRSWGITFFPLPKKSFWILKDCELLEEVVLGVLLKGGRIRRLPKLPTIEPNLLPPKNPDESDVVERIKDLMRHYPMPYGEDSRVISNTVTEIVTRRLLRLLGILRWKTPELTAQFEIMVRSMKVKDEILTNELTAPIEGLFYSYCKSRKIRVNAFEHGVTLGLSDWSMWEGRTRGMLAADRGFYHCPRAVDVVKSHAPWQEMHVIGLPKVMTNSIFRLIFKRLGRHLLGIKKKDRVIMYASDLDHNNFIWGPHLENDLQFYTKTRQIIGALCKQFPESTVVLKLYPTQRYVDAYDFTDLAKDFSNLRIVGGVDLRFLTASADLIVTSSTQSTLGWISTARVPFLVLEFLWCPTKIQGLRFLLPGITGLSAVIIPDEGAVCSGKPYDASIILCEQPENVK